jgi:uncharacterized protein (TIGR03086 family)
MAQVSIEPATDRVSELIRRLPDGKLDAPTPSDYTVGELLDHIQSFARAFSAAASKSDDPTTAGPPPEPDAARLGDGWRDHIPQLLAALADAWDEPLAWTGTTKVGGMEMPGQAAGVIALDEVVLHGWDLAVATGQPYEVPHHLLEALLSFLEHMAEPGMEPAREGLFGPVLRVDDDAPLLERILGLAGRDPRWSTSNARTTNASGAERTSLEP